MEIILINISNSIYDSTVWLYHALGFLAVYWFTIYLIKGVLLPDQWWLRILKFLMVLGINCVAFIIYFYMIGGKAGEEILTMFFVTLVATLFGFYRGFNEISKKKIDEIYVARFGPEYFEGSVSEDSLDFEWGITYSYSERRRIIIINKIIDAGYNVMIKTRRERSGGIYLISGLVTVMTIYIDKYNFEYMYEAEQERRLSDAKFERENAEAMEHFENWAKVKKQKDIEETISTVEQLSKSTQAPIAELLKKHGVIAVDKTEESLGKTSLMFSPSQEKEQEDSVGATMRNLNRAKK